MRVFGEKNLGASCSYSSGARSAQKDFSETAAPEDLLEVRAVTKTFGHGRGARTVLDDVSFIIKSAEQVALIGPSGVGKTTLARLCAGLTLPSSGEILIDGLSSRTAREHPRAWFSHVQYISQDPRTALNDRWTIERNLCEALALSDGNEAVVTAATTLAASSDTLGVTTESRTAASASPITPKHWYQRGYVRAITEEFSDQAAAAIQSVGLSTDILTRYPSQLSGGQLQRVSIARAFALRPALLILDEPTSALDSVSAGQIAELLEDIVQDRALTTLQIHHDLALAQRLCTRFISIKPRA